MLSINDEVASTSSQIVEQIEIIQGVVLPGISNSLSYMNQAQIRDQNTKHNFLQKKTLEKGK